MFPPKPKIRRWSLSDTRQVGDYGVFAVDQHRVSDAEGVSRRDVFTFRCRDWCNVIAITETGLAILVWQYRFGTDELSLEIPGGVIDPGEHPLDAARRELLEETGYEAASLDLLTTVHPNPALQQNSCYTFVARQAKLRAPQMLDELEEIEVALVPVARLAELLDGGVVRHALVHSALETFLRRGEGLSR